MVIPPLLQGIGKTTDSVGIIIRKRYFPNYPGGVHDKKHSYLIFQAPGLRLHRICPSVVSWTAVGELHLVRAHPERQRIPSPRNHRPILCAAQVELPLTARGLGGCDGTLNPKKRWSQGGATSGGGRFCYRVSVGVCGGAQPNFKERADRNTHASLSANAKP